jgi:hypothetical protein
MGFFMCILEHWGIAGAASVKRLRALEAGILGGTG